MAKLKDLSMADLLALGKYATEKIEFATEMKDNIMEEVYFNMHEDIYTEIEARVDKLFPDTANV